MKSSLSVLFEENLRQQIEYSEQWVSFGEDATKNFDHPNTSLDKSSQKSQMETVSRKLSSSGDLKLQFFLHHSDIQTCYSTNISSLYCLATMFSNVFHIHWQWKVWFQYGLELVAKLICQQIVVLRDFHPNHLKVMVLDPSNIHPRWHFQPIRILPGSSSQFNAPKNKACSLCISFNDPTILHVEDDFFLDFLWRQVEQIVKLSRTKKSILCRFI